jgi:hypothetical protein
MEEYLFNITGKCLLTNKSKDGRRFRSILAQLESKDSFTWNFQQL